MSSRETLDHILSYLVDHHDEVRIEEEESSNSIVFNLYLHPEDVGKVIGRGGRTARAIRTIVKAAATREDRNAFVEIVD